MVYIQNEISVSLKKCKKILAHATKWMKLEDIKWNEPVKKEKYCMISLKWGSKAIKFIEKEGRLVVTMGWVGRNRKLFNGHRVSALQDEKSSQDRRWWKLHKNMNVLNTTELYT